MTKLYRFILCVFPGLFLGMNVLQAQAPMPAKSAAEIQHMLKTLQVLGTVLYVAAHPDDENTRLIAYLAKGKGYRTGYLSLTRGDGGQNLIGTEKGPLLGILRTQELLAARRLDGAEQMFSRAYDFGYSKNPEETLSIWDKDKVLADVVWAIRKFRPDVIITRFGTPEDGGGGHGHHTASAMLAHEAFNLANDPNAYPEQLEFVQPWQPKRLLWNNYWVFRRYQPSEEELKGIITIDIGEFDPLLGKSYGEIASEARSKHRCQGFGASLLHGSLDEYLDHKLGDRANGELFDGITTNWERIEGGKAIGDLLAMAYENFQPSNPAYVLPLLTEAYEKMKALNNPTITHKQKELESAIAYCAGLWYEFGADQAILAQGDTVQITASVLKRSDVPVTLKKVDFGFAGASEHPNLELGKNGKVQKYSKDFVAGSFDIGQPYWLVHPQAKGIFDVRSQELIGHPQNPAAFNGRFTFGINGVEIDYETPFVRKYVDPSFGELHRPFVIAPPVTANLAEKVYLFSDDTPQQVQLLVKNHSQSAKAKVELKAGRGWKIDPKKLDLTFTKPGEEQIVSLTVRPPKQQSVDQLSVSITVNGETTSHSFQEIAYDHIPTQTLFSPAESRLVRVDLQKKGEKIGYIMGSGDEVPIALEQIGYQVDLLTDDDITPSNLAQYDAVIAGIRSYNVNKRMAFHQEKIFQYVEQGGTYIIQYNTSRGISQPGPYPIKLSRDRVTVEEAKVDFLLPDHPVLQGPNKITSKDFDGWIQERGLYFPNEWSKEYEAILSMNDPGEDPKQGSLLVAKHGQGHFIYTGLSMFRELPAGVPGAYRLFANMISIGK